MFLQHEGVKRKSGRYPWGSGENPYQHEPWFEWSQEEKRLKKEGFSDKEIADHFGISTTTLRSMRGSIKEEKRAIDSAYCYRLREKGNSVESISEITGLSPGTVRNYLKPHEQVREGKIKATAEMLKRQVDKNTYIDVGEGVELYLGCSKDRKNTALYLLKQEGYNVYPLDVPQQNNVDHITRMKILVPPGVSFAEFIKNQDKVHIIDERTNDDGKSWFDIKPPTNIDSNRVYIRYGDDGGKERDGVIELRRGVEDLDLVGKHYAQVRIATDGKYYMKGMAIYSDDIPKGYDIVYNTNKPSGTDKYDVFKEQTLKRDGTVDLENPFKAVLKSVDAEGNPVGQREYIGKDGKKHLSALNIIKEEGDWENYKKSISAQMLSKQEVPVAKTQMDISYNDKKREFEEIMSVSNPVVKQKLLKSFADDCDSSASHLKVAAFPRQCSRVLLPLTDIKDTEVYAPGFSNGEKVVLIRYPHGGRFEIPELTVNNKNRDGKKTIGNDAKDAVGINIKVAQVLSGADFDGDTVLVIPNNKGRIKGESSIKSASDSKALKSLRYFDPSEAYPAYDGMPKVTKKNFNKQLEMGKASNLITDMTLKGATWSEIARAVKYSMVVIDAEKHNLDWKTAKEDLNIAKLKKDYQGGARKGASTLISLANASYSVEKRDDLVKWDPDTGEKIYKTAKDSKRYFTGKDGTQKERKSKTTRMAEVSDARLLSSGTRMENAYADYANKLKDLANTARKEYLAVKVEKRSPSARLAYADEVDSLTNKLNAARRNAPVARKANLVASLKVKAAIADSDGTLSKDDIKKLRQKALNAASSKYGAGRKQNSIAITKKEWSAIQANAISSSMLKSILDYSDLDVVKEYATPRTSNTLSTSKLATARSLLNLGYTQAEVAERVGCSVSTLVKNL